MLVQSVPMKSRKRLDCDVFHILAAYAGHVRELADTKTAGHKMAALRVLFLSLSSVCFFFSKQNEKSRAKTAVYFVLHS